MNQIQTTHRKHQGRAARRRDCRWHVRYPDPHCAVRVAPRIVRIYTLRGFESVLAGSVQPGLLGDELA